MGPRPLRYRCDSPGPGDVWFERCSGPDQPRAVLVGCGRLDFARMEIFGAALLAFILSFGFTAYLVRPGARLRWLDHPNERSLHRVAVPRTGGLAIVAGIGGGSLLSGMLLGPPTWWPWLMGSAALVLLVAILDDRRGLGILPRLVVHLVAGAALLGSGLLPDVADLMGSLLPIPGWALSAVILLFVVWMVNLYNFMDGMDGFAAGMAVLGFGCMAFLGWRAEAGFFAAVNLSIAMASAGFLLFNFPPARIFMGDAGASLLGFLAAASILWANQQSVFPFWAGVLIFSPFIVDATATLVGRMWAREKFWLPHRQHCYQRLVRSGWSHRRTTLAGYLLMSLVGGTSIWLVEKGTGHQAVLAMALWTVIYAILVVWISRTAVRT